MSEFAGVNLTADAVRAINIGFTTYADQIQKDPNDDLEALDKSMRSFLVELPPSSLELIGDRGLAMLLWVALIRSRITIEVVDG